MILATGGALNATFNRGNRLILQNNRFGGNRMSNGASVVNIHNVGVLEPVVMDIQKNLMYIPQPAGGEVGANLLVSTNDRLKARLPATRWSGLPMVSGCAPRPRSTPTFASTCMTT